LHGIAPCAWIVNRLMPSDGTTADHDRFRDAPAGTREAVERIEADLTAVRTRERAEVERLRAAIGADAELLEIHTRVFDAGDRLELGRLADAFGEH
jgi:hypothetical protein